MAGCDRGDEPDQVHHVCLPGLLMKYYAMWTVWPNTSSHVSWNHAPTSYTWPFSTQRSPVAMNNSNILSTKLFTKDVQLFLVVRVCTKTLFKYKCAIILAINCYANEPKFLVYPLTFCHVCQSKTNSLDELYEETGQMFSVVLFTVTRENMKVGKWNMRSKDLFILYTPIIVTSVLMFNV